MVDVPVVLRDRKQGAEHRDAQIHRIPLIPPGQEDRLVFREPPCVIARCAAQAIDQAALHPWPETEPVEPFEFRWHGAVVCAPGDLETWGTRGAKCLQPRMIRFEEAMGINIDTPSGKSPSGFAQHGVQNGEIPNIALEVCKKDGNRFLHQQTCPNVPWNWPNTAQRVEPECVFHNGLT